MKIDYYLYESIIVISTCLSIITKELQIIHTIQRNFMNGAFTIPNLYSYSSSYTNLLTLHDVQ